MPRKRYNSGAKRSGSPQVQFQSTSPQRSIYEDSLTAESLIRAYLEKGGMEDPILKVLFIGGSKPKQGESVLDLDFKRLKSCWLAKKVRSYGMREVLRMKMIERGIKVDTKPKWARYSVLGATLVITPKIWINRQGEEKNFLKDFQLEESRNNQILSQPQSEFKRTDIHTVSGLKAKIIIHRWDQFPDIDPVVCGEVNSKKIYHFMIDDLDVYIISYYTNPKLITQNSIMKIWIEDRFKQFNKTCQIMFTQREEEESYQQEVKGKQRSHNREANPR